MPTDHRHAESRHTEADGTWTVWNTDTNPSGAILDLLNTASVRRVTLHVGDIGIGRRKVQWRLAPAPAAPEPVEPPLLTGYERGLGCPDGGRCHHESCTTSECFRVACCGSLTGAFPDLPDGEWPEGARPVPVTP